MKIRNFSRLTTAISVILLAGGQVCMVQAADEDHSGIAAPPKFTPSTESYPPPPPGGWDAVVKNIDKQIESDMQQTESGRPADPAAAAGSGTQFGGAPRFPEFQDPPEWGQRAMPQPSGRADRGMPAAPGAPAWPEPDTTSQPDWAQSQQPRRGGSHYAPQEWGGGPMPEPPEWGDRSMPKPPGWAGGDMPEPPQWGHRSEPEPPTWAGRNIPTPSDWSRAPSYPPQRYDRGRGYRSPYDSGRGPSFGSPPYGGSRGPGYRGPWDSGRGGRGDDFSPFGRSGPSFDAPWDSGRGGRSTPWSRGKKGKGGWMDRDWFADSWDDMLNAPSDMGEMPGGWYAPSVSVPNPVDVGDEFGTAAEDMPTQMRNVYDDNRRYNSRSGGYDRYDRYDGYGR